MASKVQDCDCGFTDVHDPSKSTFTSFFAVDFSSTASKDLDKIFIPASYEVQSSTSSFARNYSASQIQILDTGLHLTVSPPEAHEVPCAQLFTRSSSFFYGSYHALFRVSDVKGTVTAFFNYKNDSSEVDIEYLSAWDDPTLLNTVKPQIYLENGNPANSTYQEAAWTNPSVPFSQDFHEWSFVWLQDIVHYGLDGDYSSNITTNVPQGPGRLAVSQWSDGNPNYSLGPPTENSTVVVSFLWATYNDTGASALACKKSTSPCTIANGIFQSSSQSSSNNDNNNNSSSSSSSINGGAAPTSTVIVNSPQSIGSSLDVGTTAPGWIMVFMILLWHHSWRFL